MCSVSGRPRTGGGEDFVLAANPQRCVRVCFFFYAGSTAAAAPDRSAVAAAVAAGPISWSVLSTKRSRAQMWRPTFRVVPLRSSSYVSGGGGGGGTGFVWRRRPPLGSLSLRRRPYRQSFVCRAAVYSSNGVRAVHSRSTTQPRLLRLCAVFFFFSQTHTNSLRNAVRHRFHLHCAPPPPAVVVLNKIVGVCEPRVFLRTRHAPPPPHSTNTFRRRCKFFFF